MVISPIDTNVFFNVNAAKDASNPVVATGTPKTSTVSVETKLSAPQRSLA